MDPQAAWEGLIATYAQGDYESAQEFAVSLHNWLQKGGFPPIVLGNQDLGPDFESALAQAGCAFIMDAVTARWATTESTAAKATEDA